MALPVRIACMGELLVEFVCTRRNGHHRVPASYTGPFPSGAPGIFIDQAARIGGNAIFIGAVGNDAFGQVLLDRLSGVGVAPDLISVARGIPTGTAFVSYNDDGSRDFVYNIALSAASHFSADTTTLAKLADFGLDVMHVSGSALADPDMATKILHTCRTLHSQGVAISFDPNIRKELMGNASYLDVVRTLMGICRYFLPSEEDAVVLFPGESMATFGQSLLASGVEAVVLKRGERGTAGLTRLGDPVDLAGHKVEVVDPTGAGDCFCATFVTLMASGTYSFQAALQRANAAGALSVGKIGPMEGNSTLAEIETFLAVRS